MKYIKSKYKYISLNNGGKVRVDKVDYKRLRKYDWNRIELDKCTYAVTYINGNHVYMHRLIMNVLDKGKHIFVDHRDNNGLHNNRDNLRVCNNAQNQWNTHKRTHGRSKHKGVTWHEKTGKWMARIRIGGGKRLYLGDFEDEDKAGLAYNEACLENHGEFAVLNDIPILN